MEDLTQILHNYIGGFEKLIWWTQSPDVCYWRKTMLTFWQLQHWSHHDCNHHRKIPKRIGKVFDSILRDSTSIWPTCTETEGLAEINGAVKAWLYQTGVQSWILWPGVRSATLNYWSLGDLPRSRIRQAQQQATPTPHISGKEELEVARMGERMGVNRLKSVKIWHWGEYCKKVAE